MVEVMVEVMTDPIMEQQRHHLKHMLNHKCMKWSFVCIWPPVKPQQLPEMCSDSDFEMWQK